MLAKRLRVLMDEKNLSLTAFAREISVAKSTVQGWLVDGSSPSLEHLQAISNYFNVSLDFLISGKSESDLLESMLESTEIHAGIYKLTISKVKGR